MALIQITPEMLEQQASTLRTLRGDHDGTMSRITNLVNGLNEVWKGDAQEAYVAKYQSMQSTFTNFSELLEGYAKLMDLAAREFRTRDQELRSTMSNFGN